MSRFFLVALPLVVGCTEHALDLDGTGVPGVDSQSDAESAAAPHDSAIHGSVDTDDTPSEFRSTLRGDFGDLGRFAAELSEIEVDVGPENSSVTLHTLGEHGWAMLRIRLAGQLGHGQLRAGETVYLSGFSIEPGEDGVVVGGAAQGCAGPDMWDFDDDQFTQEAVIGLSQHPDTGSLIMTIEADFSDGGNMVASALIE